MDCNICCETINKTSRKAIVCPSCDEVCCKQCFTRVLLDNHTPSCMFCKKGYSYLFIASQVTRKFYEDDYMKHRAKDELSKEKSLLPVTQNQLPLFVKLREIDMERKELSEELSYLTFRIKELNKLMKEEHSEDTEEELEEMKECRKRGTIIRRRFVYLKGNERYLRSEGHLEGDKEPSKTFSQACPVNGCRGFLSTVWKCGTCEKYICCHCHEVKNCRDDKKHICDKNTVESIKALKKECKPCPGCKVPIFKIDGCDLMWCTQPKCHTQFSWKKGTISKGHNHNPHYYQWLRERNNGQIPRHPDDNDCGGRCGELPWIDVIEILLMQKSQAFLKLENCHRLVAELRDMRLPPMDNTKIRLKNRILYLLGELSEEKWINILAQDIKTQEYREEYNNILSLTADGIEDTFINFSKDAVENLEQEMQAFREYVNVQFQQLKCRYKKKSLIVTKQWLIKYR